jgi:hypothetical protein
LNNIVLAYVLVHEFPTPKRIRVNANVNKANKDMSAYHAPLKTIFDGARTVGILKFLA